MPRFTIHHVLTEQYTDDELADFHAALGLNVPCDIHVCTCKRLTDYTFGVLCGCYRGTTLPLEPGQGRCACELVALARDERFAAYLLAWRRRMDWHDGDRAQDAESFLEAFAEALGTTVAEMVKPYEATPGPYPERPSVPQSDWS